jgi:hypothetical protein
MDDHNQTQAKFYRDLVNEGFGEECAVVAALTPDEEIVATVLGIRREDYIVFLRISNAGKRWSHCSPSRLNYRADDGLLTRERASVSSI